jgi:signal transduction histidine kinase
MSVPVTPRPRRLDETRPLSLTPSLVLLAAAAVATAVVSAVAPEAARGWVVGTAVTGWLLLAAVSLVGLLLLRRSRRGALDAGRETVTAHTRLAQSDADAAHLVDVTLPAVVKKARDGAAADTALASVQQPSDEQLRRVLDVFATQVVDSERRAGTAGTERDAASRRLARATEGLEQLMSKSLPAAMAILRKGNSADTVLAEADRPDDPRLRDLMDTVIRELAVSERRALAAQTASAKALSQVQAKAISMLADLRDMQDRCGEEMFGDLLRLDHNTSQLGLLTDRLAILMGGRGSRAWNKPIVMENILRGAVGRIAAYRRVRMHCSSGAAIAGFAAEGVMHLLAELMDNAANFSPPIDEVHVYVEERTAGIVITVEDSGLRMADAAMRRAEESVSGRANDLALLQGTRLGLAVVGRLAAKYRMSVNYRPSSRGGTGVVVLIPPQLVAQRRGFADEGPAPRGPLLDTVPAPAPRPEPAPPAAPPSFTGGPRVATPGGLPVRPPGRTMAAADRDRQQEEDPTGRPARPGRGAGEQFGAFHRSRRAPQGPSDKHQES